jgi:hypothetical protein
VRPAPVCAPGTRVCARHPCVRPAPVCAPGTRVCAHIAAPVRPAGITAAYFSIGTPTEFPHSVQLPS